MTETILSEKANHHEVKLHVNGMMCQKSCAATVREALLSQRGCLSADASFSTASATVTVDLLKYVQRDALDASDKLTVISQLEKDIVEVIECIGFEASVVQRLEQSDMVAPGIILQEWCKEKTDESTSEESIDSDVEVREMATKLLGNKSSHVSPFDEMGEEKIIITLQVSGMSCAVCTRRVEQALSCFKFVHRVSVNLVTGRVKIWIVLKEGKAKTAESISSDIDSFATSCTLSVRNAGYDCELINISQRLLETKSVSSTIASNVTSMKDCRDRDLSIWKRQFIISSIFTLPLAVFHFIHMTDHHDMNTGESRSVGWEGWFCFILASIVQFYIGKRFYIAAYHSFKNGRIIGMDFLVVLGTSAAYIYSLILLYIRLIPHETTDSVDKKMHLHMRPPFETGAMLITFVTLGKYMEAYAKGKTASALQRLMELQPILALRCDVPNDYLHDGPNGVQILREGNSIQSLVTEDINIDDVALNDFLLVLPGARVPTDGVVISTGNATNKAYVDESTLTGEPYPVLKELGDTVYGSTVNQLSFLLIRVTAIGPATALGSIITLMEEAQCNRSEMQATVDRISSLFAPFVVCVSTLTFIFWMIFNHTVNVHERTFTAVMSAISVVVVACPCALGLATPTAVMVGTGVGASMGMLIKGGAVLERAHLIDTVVFDKTGTLTNGRAHLVERVEFLDCANDDEILFKGLPEGSTISRADTALWLAACIERNNTHPVGQAIFNEAKNLFGIEFMSYDNRLQISDVNIIPGEGVEGTVSRDGWGRFKVRVGTRDFSLQSSDIDSALSLADQQINSFRQSGYTGVFVTVSLLENFSSALCVPTDKEVTRIVCVLGIADTLKKGAKSTVSALRQLGIDVWLCTGDHSVTADIVARAVGINYNNVLANARPEDKAALVGKLQENIVPSGQKFSLCSDRIRNARVAFVGDGINDCVALARASVGIAMGTGTSIAIDSADIILTRSDLHDVVVALHLSQVVFNRIKVNLLWATGYNLFAIPFAAGVFYPFTDWKLPPGLAAFMMAFSSVSVVASSLCLRTYTKPVIEDDGTIIDKVVCCGPARYYRAQESHETKHLVRTDDDLAFEVV